ncbi:MAG: hypothetical protein ACK4ZJ_16985, partial [Allorhizobium sp.]
MVANAIKHVCLAGAHQQQLRDSALQAMDEQEGVEQFVLLLNESMNYRGVYAVMASEEDGQGVVRVHGTGPDA